MLGIYLGVMAALYILYQKMIAGPENEEAERKAAKEKKKADKKKK